MNKLFNLTSLVSMHTDREGNYFFDDEDIHDTLFLMLSHLSHEEDKKDEEKLSTKLTSLYHDIASVWNDDEACLIELKCYFNELTSCIVNIKVACEFRPCIYSSISDYDEQRNHIIMMMTSLTSEFISTAKHVIASIDSYRSNPWFQLEEQSIATLNDLIDIYSKLNCERKVFLLLQENVKGGSNND